MIERRGYCFEVKKERRTLKKKTVRENGPCAPILVIRDTTFFTILKLYIPLIP